MKKINLKKYLAFFSIIAALSPILFSFQNFRHYEAVLNIEKDESSTTHAFSEALKTAEAEQTIALNQENKDKEIPKKVRKPSMIGDERHFLDSRHDLNSDEMNSEGVKVQMSSHLAEE